MSTPENTPKRLTRSRTDRVIGGVCGGLGRYFNVDPIFSASAPSRWSSWAARGCCCTSPRCCSSRTRTAEPRSLRAPQGRNRALVIAACRGAAGRRLALSSRRRASRCGAWDPARRSGRCRRARLVARLRRGTERRRRATSPGVRRSGSGSSSSAASSLVGGASAAAAGPDWLVAALVIAAGAAIAGRRLPQARALAGPARRWRSPSRPASSRPRASTWTAASASASTGRPRSPTCATTTSSASASSWSTCATPTCPRATSRSRSTSASARRA